MLCQSRVYAMPKSFQDPPKKNDKRKEKEREFLDTMNRLATRIPWVVVIVVTLVVLYTIAELLFRR